MSNYPNYNSSQFLRAADLLAASTTALGADHDTNARLHYNGIVNGGLATFGSAGMVLNINMPSPFCVEFGSGALTYAHGTVSNVDTQVLSANLAPLVPGSGSVTCYLLLSAVTIQQGPLTVVGPPQGHPSYNPNFTPYTGYTTNVESLALTASLTPADNVTTFEVCRTTLTAGQSTITSVTNAYQVQASSLLSATGITAGTYQCPTITVDQYGRLSYALSTGPYLLLSGGTVTGNLTVDGTAYTTTIQNSGAALIAGNLAVQSALGVSGTLNVTGITSLGTLNGGAASFSSASTSGAMSVGTNLNVAANIQTSTLTATSNMQVDGALAVNGNISTLLGFYGIYLSITGAGGVTQNFAVGTSLSVGTSMTVGTNLVVTDNINCAAFGASGNASANGLYANYLDITGNGSVTGTLETGVLEASSSASGANWANQGSIIAWNNYNSTIGEVDFICSKGGGAGGFYFFNVASSSGASPVLLATISGAGSAAFQSINATPIGTTGPSTGAFTTVSAQSVVSIQGGAAATWESRLTGGGTDSNNSDISVNTGGIAYRFVNDAYTGANNYLSVTRSGYAATVMSLVTNTSISLNAPSLYLNGGAAISGPFTMNGNIVANNNLSIEPNAGGASHNSWGLYFNSTNSGSTTLTGVMYSDTSGNFIVQPTTGACVSINDPSSASTVQLQINSPSNGDGANFKLIGNGSTTPSKTLRVNGGQLQIINNGYTASVWSCDDLGNTSQSASASMAGLTVGTGGIVCNGGQNITGQLYVAGATLLTGATSTGQITVGGSASQGGSQLNPGGGSNSGYLALLNPTGGRVGYVGYAPTGGGTAVLQAESTTTGWSTNLNFTIGGTCSAVGGIWTATHYDTAAFAAGPNTYFFNPTNNATFGAYLGGGAVNCFNNTGNAAAQFGIYGATQIVGFSYNGTTVGGITTNGSSTAYVTSSDYRLKENMVPVDDALERIKQVKVYRGNFISHPDEPREMVIAHEFAEVIPHAVHGDKDAVDVHHDVVLRPDGSIAATDMSEDEFKELAAAETPRYPEGSTWHPEHQVLKPQGVDYAQSTPLLMAAVQALIAQNEALAARIAVLESR